jgi:hypothetical protein
LEEEKRGEKRGCSQKLKRLIAMLSESWRQRKFGTMVDRTEVKVVGWEKERQRRGAAIWATQRTGPGLACLLVTWNVFEGSYWLIDW